MSNPHFACKYCRPCKVDGQTKCGEKIGMMYCTREQGHPGQHVACGYLNHVYIHWLSEDDNAKVKEGGLAYKEIETLPY